MVLGESQNGADAQRYASTSSERGTCLTQLLDGSRTGHAPLPSPHRATTPPPTGSAHHILALAIHDTHADYAADPLWTCYRKARGLMREAIVRPLHDPQH